MKQVTSFYLGECLFGIESAYVNSVLSPGKSIRIPQKEEQLFNRTMTLADGRFIHVINAEKLFGLDHGPVHESSKVIVLQSERPLMGLMVDAIANLGEFDSSELGEILPLSKINKKFLSGTLTGADGEVVLLLNAKALIDALTRSPL